MTQNRTQHNVYWTYIHQMGVNRKLGLLWLFSHTSLKALYARPQISLFPQRIKVVDSLPLGNEQLLKVMFTFVAQFFFGMLGLWRLISGILDSTPAHQMWFLPIRSEHLEVLLKCNSNLFSSPFAVLSPAIQSQHHSIIKSSKGLQGNTNNPRSYPASPH